MKGRVTPGLVSARRRLRGVRPRRRVDSQRLTTRSTWMTATVRVDTPTVSVSVTAHLAEGLIIVWDDPGRLLTTPQARRHPHGRRLRVQPHDGAKRGRHHGADPRIPRPHSRPRRDA